MKDSYHVTDIIEFCQQNWPQSDSAIHRYVLHLHRLSNIEMQRAEPVMAEFGLTMTEFDLLATLRRGPEPHVLTPTELQRSTLLSSGGQTKVLHQLEERGLVSRSVDKEDKRSKLVHLTKIGKSVIENAMAAVMDELDSGIVAANLSPQELAQLTKLMGKLLQALETDTGFEALSRNGR